MVQYGIDLYGCVRAGYGWPALGGHRSGRKAPIVFAGILLGNTNMKHVSDDYPNQFGEDMQAYGYVASYGIAPACEREAVEQLVELQHRAGDYARRDGRVAEDEFFFAEQNARLVKNAEEYYRHMFHGSVVTWNLRDRHMADTLAAIAQHLDRKKGRPSRIVVWAHNSHVGDARATEMGEQGQLNLGQLAREAYGDQAFLIGFTTHAGAVTAASNSDEPARRKRVRPSIAGSHERLFHEVGLERFLLLLRAPSMREASREPRLERAIGVIYRPETERLSHYFRARLPDQFDAVLHIDETSALEPLEQWAHDEIDLPETYPSGM